LYTIVPDVSYLGEKDLSPAEGVVDSLTAAMWYFKQGRSFEDTLVRVVNRGGEAGTIGAVAGALGGARWGLVLALARRLARLSAGL
jgi:ADP-ribosyl-[dinitrogen reductase] hydrolase